MGKSLLTPWDFSDAVPAGRKRFWKQVLPVTSIDYNGQKVNFDPQFHMDLAQSFKDKAFDQVPIVFANEGNRHNMDPRNFGGDVLDMEFRGNKPGPEGGTWALVEADRTAARAIKRNPKLGVSARIRQLVEKADGRKFDRAIEHICLTMNPRVTGMGPWQAVDLSDGDADLEVVDLTAITYEEGKPMARKTTTKPRRTGDGKIDLSSLTDDEFNRLLDLAEDALDDEEDDGDEDGDDQDEVEVPPVAGSKTRRKKSKTKITVEKDSEDDGDEDDEDDEDDATDLSDTDKVIRRNEVSQFQKMRLDLAESRWATERGNFEAAGVPPFLLDLAEPVLSLPDALTIDLADDETLDASDTVRKMLDGVKGIIDLTGEMGHQIDLSDRVEETDSATAFLKAWDEQNYG